MKWTSIAFVFILERIRVHKRNCTLSWSSFPYTCVLFTMSSLCVYWFRSSVYETTSFRMKESRGFISFRTKRNESAAVRILISFRSALRNCLWIQSGPRTWPNVLFVRIFCFIFYWICIYQCVTVSIDRRVLNINGRNVYTGWQAGLFR